MAGAAPIVEPPAASLLMRIESPGFDTAAPERLHAERMPPGILAACGAQAERRFAPRPVRAWLLDDVVVGFEGLVFDRAGALYRPSVTQHAPEEVAMATDAARQLLAGGPAAAHDLPVVLAKKRGAANYGHWLMEMLPMLHLVTDRLGGAGLGVLVHDVTDPQLGEVMQTSLRRLGMPDVRVRVTGLEPVAVRRLILVEGLTVHGTYMSPLLRPCHERLVHGIDGIGQERVFVARAAGLRRNFSEPLRIERLAAEGGYHVLRTDGLSLREQVAAVRDARVVAGAMGAAMTALAFARAPAQALLFAGAEMPDTFFWFLANLFGHRYREVRCLQAEARDEAAAFYDRDLLIDDDEFRERLAAA